MLTPFGRFLRKLRIDNGELMKNMADRLKVTPSYLSAVEVGKKPVPASWLDILKSSYALSDATQLRNLAELSKPEFRLEIPRGTDDLRRETAMTFARKVGELDHESLMKILDVMLKRGECE